MSQHTVQHGVRERELGRLFRTLEQLNSLKRFHCMEDPLSSHEIVAGVAKAGKRLRSLESCRIHASTVVFPYVQLEANTAELMRRILNQSACEMWIRRDGESWKYFCYGWARSWSCTLSVERRAPPVVRDASFSHPFPLLTGRRTRYIYKRILIWLEQNRRLCFW
jgi:hypothetical protein